MSFENWYTEQRMRAYRGASQHRLGLAAFEAGEAEARKSLEPFLLHHPVCEKVLARSKWPFAETKSCTCGLDAAMGVHP